jgi:hypothetical protein
MRQLRAAGGDHAAAREPDPEPVRRALKASDVDHPEPDPSRCLIRILFATCASACGLAAAAHRAAALSADSLQDPCQSDGGVGWWGGTTRSVVVGPFDRMCGNNAACRAADFDDSNGRAVARLSGLVEIRCHAVCADHLRTHADYK